VQCDVRRASVVRSPPSPPPRGSPQSLFHFVLIARAIRPCGWRLRHPPPALLLISLSRWGRLFACHIKHPPPTLPMIVSSRSLRLIGEPSRHPPPTRFVQQMGADLHTASQSLAAPHSRNGYRRAIDPAGIRLLQTPSVSPISEILDRHAYGDLSSPLQMPHGRASMHALRLGHRPDALGDQGRHHLEGV
jgi:hypothetical protein